MDNKGNLPRVISLKSFRLGLVREKYGDRVKYTFVRIHTDEDISYLIIHKTKRHMTLKSTVENYILIGLNYNLQNC